MGIKGFSILLKHIECNWKTASLSSFAGQVMAIDGFMYLYQAKLSAKPPARIFIDFFLQLQAAKIKPVFIMDGKYVLEKAQEQAYRAQRNRNLQNIIEKLQIQLEQYKQTKQMGKELTKLVNSNPQKFINRLSKTLNVHMLSNHIEKLLREVSPITKQIKDLFLDICHALKIPVIWAKNDGEMLCAMLNKLGKVDIVFSHDSDVFPAGAVNVIKQITGPMVKTLSLSNILSAANLSFASFRDLCILCGTDFNKRLPGLGPITAYNLIRAHGCLEKIMSETEYNIKSINYNRVREIYIADDDTPEIVFRHPDAIDVIEVAKKHQLDLAELKKIDFSSLN